MKRLIGLGVAVGIFVLVMAGCGTTGPSTHLIWGDVEYETHGEAQLNEVEVTRDKDGNISLKLGSSSHSEAKANLMAMEAIKEAISKIPAIPIK